MHPLLLPSLAAAVGLLVGPRLAVASARLAGGDRGRPSPPRRAGTALLLAALLAGAVALAGARPATAGLAWAAAAGVVLAGVDLAVHRLPDRVTYPALAACTAAFLGDAALTGSWPALGRAVLAASAAGVLAAGVWLVRPAGLGLGDVKLLVLVGLVLGWMGWSVLAAGVVLGLLAGSVAAVALIAAGRAGWRTALPFGPPLLLGAVLAVALAGPLPG